MSFQVPSLSGCKIGVFVICAVFATKKESLQWWTDFGVVIHNKTRGYREVFLPGAYQFLVNESDHLFLIKGHVIRNEVFMLGAPERRMKMISGEEIEVSFELSSSAEVKKCGVHLEVDGAEVTDKYGSTSQCVDSDTATCDKVSEIDAAVDYEVSVAED